MTAPIPPAELRRLALTLGLLGSPHSGERDASAQAAHRTIRRLGVSWSELLATPAPQPPEPRQRPQPGGFCHVAGLCLERHVELTPAEIAFLRALQHQDGITGPQRAALDCIVDRLSAG